MPNKPNPQQLAAENEDLRARLEKAEETLREILSGEADALFVAGVGGAQLFTLKGADQVYRTLIENMSEGALTMTAEGVILYANRRFAEMLKTPLEKVIGSTIHTWIAPDSQLILQALLGKGADEKHRAQLDLTASDGTQVPVYVSVSKLHLNGMPDAFCLVATDLTEQKRIEAIAASAKLARELLAAANQSRRALLSVIQDQKRAEIATEHAVRALAALSAVNHNLVHATDENELLQVICQTIVEQRGYRMAWVGYVQHDESKSIKIMARAGHDEGYLDAMQLTCAETERGMGPSGRAIRSGTTQLCQDIANDSQYLPWRDEALKNSYAASIALPLLNADNTVFGTLAVYSNEMNAFSPTEVSLLEEMAVDLAFGVRSLYIRHERDLALVKNQEQLVQLVFQNEEKEKRAVELAIANKELVFQNEEKEKRAAELVIANKELVFQNEEKEKRAAELVIANKELIFQNEEKEKRAAELAIANKELVFQNEEKEKRAAELTIANKELQDSLEDTVRAIATIGEMRDPYTSGHQVRVADLATAIAKQLGLHDEQVHAIHLAGVVHDLGKIKIPAEILSKPGRITDIEFSLIKVHPQAGYDILKGIDFPWPIAQMVLQHHERLDGSGYPQGLKGDDILLEARILSVADVVEAMSSHRPYRPGLGIEVALAEITRQRGIHFDPAVVDACLALFREQHYSFKS